MSSRKWIKNIILVVIFMAVISIIALFAFKLINKKSLYVETTSLQEFAGANILSETAYNDKYLCQILSSYNPTDSNSDFDAAIFSMLIYDLKDGSTASIDMVNPERRSLQIGGNVCTYASEGITITDESILVSFTCWNFKENNDSGKRDIVSIEPVIYSYSLEGDYTGSIFLDNDETMILKQGEIEADCDYIYLVEYPYITDNVNSDTSPNTEYLMVYDYEGNLIYKRNVYENAQLIKDSNKGILLSDDNQISHIYGMEDTFISEIKPSTVIIQSGDNKYDYLYKKGVEIYGYSVANKKETKVLKVDDSFEMMNVGLVYYFEDMLYSAYNRGDVSADTLLTLKYGPEANKDNDNKIVIATIDAYYKDGRLSDSFVAKHPSYHVEIKQYQKQEDLIEGIAKGDRIDLIDLRNIDVNKLYDKGLLVDYYELIDDKELDKSDYIAEVMNVFEADGHLYEAFWGYYPITVITNNSVNIDEWNYEELLRVTESNKNLFYREEMMDFAYLTSYNSILNLSEQSGKIPARSCDFYNDKFKSDFSNTKMYPAFEEVFPDEDVQIDWIDLLEKRGMIERSVSIYDLVAISDYNDKRMGVMNIVGYPIDDESVSYLYEVNNIGILSTTNNKELAWEYVRPLFTAEYQAVECYRSGAFPTNKEALDILNDVICSTKEHEVAYIGSVPKFSSNKAFDKEYDNFAFEYANRVNIEKYEGQLMNARRYQSDDFIKEVILEEAQGYWRSSKTVDDCLDIITSRVNIYINE